MRDLKGKSTDYIVLGVNAQEFENQRGESFEKIVKTNLSKVYTETVESLDYKDFTLLRNLSTLSNFSKKESADIVESRESLKEAIQNLGYHVEEVTNHSFFSHNVIGASGILLCTRYKDRSATR